MFAINRPGLAAGLAATIALAMATTAAAQEKKRNLLIIGESKGYQHDSISTAMATLYNLGRNSHHWDTFFRTDCTALTKKPLKGGAKNLDAAYAWLEYTAQPFTQKLLSPSGKYVAATRLDSRICAFMPLRMKSLMNCRL